MTNLVYFNLCLKYSWQVSITSTCWEKGVCRLPFLFVLNINLHNYYGFMKDFSIPEERRKKRKKKHVAKRKGRLDFRTGRTGKRK